MQTSVELLIAKSLRGEATRDEEARLQAWREESPRHERQFLELRAIHEMAPKLLEDFDSGAPPSAADLIGTIDPAVGRRRPTMRRWAWGAAAAAVAATLAIGLHHLTFPADEAMSLRAKEIVAAADAMETIALSDGTVVRLSPGSRLEVLADPHARVVKLEGRAFFAVSHRAGHPFLVKSEAGDVRVLGTRFDLSVTRQRLQLMVIEGRVRLSAAEGEVEVEGGTEVNAIGGQLGVPTAIVDMDRATSWVGAFLAFQSTPLAAAAREIERRYGVDVEITDDELKGRVITAWFEDEPLSEVVEVVCLAVVARCEIDGGVVWITRR